MAALGPLQPGRRRLLRAAAVPAAASLASRAVLGQTIRPSPMHTRPIPCTGEPLPVIGCGTYLGFAQTPDTAAYAALPGVVEVLFNAGGSVLDSSPMHGRAEQTTGELLAGSGRRDQAFLATKGWTRGREDGERQMQASLRWLRTDCIDLMQVHNLLDWRTQLATLRRWKDDGRIRYLGVSHYTASAYAELEAVLRGQTLDFVQVNYALDDRQAQQRVLPLAADRGVAVIVNRPFGGGGLLRGLLPRPLPPWAG